MTDVVGPLFPFGFEEVVKDVLAKGLFDQRVLLKLIQGFASSCGCPIRRAIPIWRWR